jgi:hypothetical protein
VIDVDFQLVMNLSLSIISDRLTFISKCRKVQKLLRMLDKVKRDRKERRVISSHLKLTLCFSKLVLNLYIIFIQLYLSSINVFIASLSNLFTRNLVE